MARFRLGTRAAWTLAVIAAVLVVSMFLEVSISDGARAQLAISRGALSLQTSRPNTIGWVLRRPDYVGLRVRAVSNAPGLTLLPSYYRGGFGFSPFGSSTKVLRVWVPLWPVLLLPLALVRRKRRGACPTCGYNLRGISGSVCPECGGERRPDLARGTA
jgi:hypothetical protein